MYYPDLETIQKEYSQNSYKKVPISLTLFSDFITPIEALRKLKTKSQQCFILESIEDNERWGRYTFLGFQPQLCITLHDHVLKVDQKLINENPKTLIRQILSEHKSPRIKGLPTFTGGLVGYFSYDYLKYSEPTLILDANDDEGFKDLDVMLFDQVICFDHYKQQIILIVNISLDNVEEEYNKGIQKLEALKTLLYSDQKANIPHLHLESDFIPLFDENEFCSMVEKAKQYIIDGDIFQVVLSNRIEAKASGSLFDTYRILRTTNPSPYMFYFTSDDLEIAGASPETLVKLDNQKLYTFPLAGTRPRGKNKQEDKLLEIELLADEKELAEHNMLVDLGRNDIGKISQIGSVKVENYHSIQRYSHVMHIGSTVTGIIDDRHDAIDAIEALLPAGTLSGAPKIRACEIINELENNKRGIYGGAIGYLDFSGNLDVCIAIRLAYMKNHKVFARSGAGIVYDSIPLQEHQECLNKIKAVTNALILADGGIDNDSTH